MLLSVALLAGCTIAPTNNFQVNVVCHQEQGQLPKHCSKKYPLSFTYKFNL